MRTRHIVILFAATLAIITYVDRVCMSQAKPYLTEAFGLGDEEMGYLFAAFTLAYSLFEIPAGWLADRYGARGVLLKVVTLWSAFTALTGMAWDYASLLVCRFLFGVGEAGCFPSLTKIFTVWLPAKERSIAQGIMWLYGRWGGAFTPLLVVAVFHWVGWRGGFVVFGFLGIIWAVIFAGWFRDDPRKHPAMSGADLAELGDAPDRVFMHEPVPWGRFVRSRTVWMLWLQYFCMSYGWYFYITWLPTYLMKERGMEGYGQALLAGIPLFFGGMACFAGGLLTNFLTKRIPLAKTRRSIGVCFLLLAGILWVLTPTIRSPLLAMIALGGASFANDMVMAGAWGACMDVGRRCAGSLSGSMNMMGNLGGVCSPIVVGWIMTATDNTGWNLVFYVTGCVYVIGALCWLLIDPVTPLDEGRGESS